MLDFTGYHGKNFIVIEKTGEKLYRCLKWKCKCYCGEIFFIPTNEIKRRQSCGCMKGRPITHGLSRENNKETRLFTCWSSMMARCYRKTDSHYKNYGARGIKVCKKWHKLEIFFYDMGHPPFKRSLDRINNDGHYEPSNCRWATTKQQSLNKRNTILIDGETILDIANRINKNYHFVHYHFYKKGLKHGTT